MRKQSLLLGTVLALTVPLMAASPAQAIKGGTESTRAYSFMGSFQPSFPAPPRPDKHGCGVEVLAPQWVLTASHCAGKNPTGARVGVPRGWKVRVGSLDTTSGGEVAEVDHYYRLATNHDEGGFWGKDLALLHLRTPVRAKPVRIASATPPENTPVRIMGWGMTCDDIDDPACLPTRLREADTVVQPLSVCPVAEPSGDLCVGSRDGSVAAANMDSGGPALVRDGDEWALAGVVSGPGANIDSPPTLYTDVALHADWINGIISGTDVPPDDARTTGARLSAAPRGPPRPGQARRRMARGPGSARPGRAWRPTVGTARLRPARRTPTRSAVEPPDRPLRRDTIVGRKL